MKTVFISYNRQSEAIAKTLAGDIEALGNTVWFDQGLSGGQSWWDHILENIRNCDVFIFLLDPDSLNSVACKQEYGYATALGKPILPILVSGGVSTNLLPSALSQIQFVDYQKQDREDTIRLARALTTITPPASLPDPLPPPPEIPLSYLGSLAEQVDAISNMSYEEQSVLVVDLKKGLRDPGTADDVRTVLSQLRKRRDLFANIAEEIDDLLKYPKQTSSIPKSSVEPQPSAIVDKSKTDDKRPITTMAHYKTTLKKRIKHAILGSFLGAMWAVTFCFLLDYFFVNGLLNDYAFMMIPGVIGGAIAGAIGGRDKKVIVYAIIWFFLVFGIYYWVYMALGLGYGGAAGTSAEVMRRGIGQSVFMGMLGVGAGEIIRALVKWLKK